MGTARCLPGVKHPITEMCWRERGREEERVKERGREKEKENTYVRERIVKKS